MSHVCEMLMLSLHHSILLGGFYTTCLVYNSLNIIKILHAKLKAISTHYFIGFIELSHQIDPCKTCVAINSSKIILVSMHRRGGTWSLNINVNNIKSFLYLEKMTGITYISVTMNVRIFLFQNVQYIVKEMA